MNDLMDGGDMRMEGGEEVETKIIRRGASKQILTKPIS